jgi:hypothetical protein
MTESFVSGWSEWQVVELAMQMKTLCPCSELV